LILIGFDPPKLVDHIHGWENSDEAETAVNYRVDKSLGCVSILFVKGCLVGRDKSLAGSLWVNMQVRYLEA
jgi:hypothetical protein